MKLPLHIAKKLEELLAPGKMIAGSLMQHTVVAKMLEDGILQRQQTGKTKSLIFIADKSGFNNYLHNHFGIADLQQYITVLAEEELSRADAVQLSGNSKLQSIRTFKGFLVNSYEPVPATLNNKPIIISPEAGTYTYMYDYANFIPDQSVTIVGIENAENFRHIEKQQYLFKDIRPLFVSRYPQSNDLIKWLKSIPNNYLHFGDLDFEGIKIYQHEFKKHLKERAGFFVPQNTEELLQLYGNRDLYNQQYASRPANINEQPVEQLTKLLLQYKKVLEQEVFIKQ